MANLKLGRSKQAEPILRKALAMFDASLPSDSNGFVPRASIDLADAYIANKKFWEAEPLLLSAAETATRVLRNRPGEADQSLHSTIAESQYKLASLYASELERPELSDSLFETAAREYEEDTLVAFTPEADSCLLGFESHLRDAGAYERADSISGRLRALRERRVASEQVAE